MINKSWIRLSGVYGLVFLGVGLLTSICYLLFLNAFPDVFVIAELVIGVVLLAVHQVFFFGEAMKNLWRKKDAFLGVFGGVAIFFILVGINVIANVKFDELKWDLTVNKIHSLSDTSIQILKDLPQDIRILSFVTDPRANKLLKNEIDKYMSQTERLSFQMVDPDLDPSLLTKHDASINDIIILNEETGKSVKLNTQQLTEQEITTGIRRALVEEEKIIYFLQGNGEGALDDQTTERGLFIAKFLLEREGYKVRALDLSQTPSIPEDANLVVAWGAERPVSFNVIQRLQEYLKSGGSLVVGQDPIIAPAKDRMLPSGYEIIAADYGLRMSGGVIIQILNYQGRSRPSMLAMGVEYGQNTLAAQLSGNVTQFSVAQAIEEAAKAPEGVDREAIVLSGKQAFIEQDIQSIFNDKLQVAGKKQAALPLGQIARLKTKDSESTLIMYGDSDFGTNALIQNAFNRDLFLNTFSYLLGVEENITIRPKTWKTSTLEIDDGSRRAVYFASVFVFPQFIMLLGLFVWNRRRSRA